jgi:hypothetical protein
MNALLIKSLLMNAASNLAAAVVSNLPDTLSTDPDIKNPETQAENLMGFRCTHVFYDGLIRALDPKTGWNTPGEVLSSVSLPELKEGAPLLSKLADVAKAFGVSGPLTDVVQKLVGTLSGVVDAIPKIPSPAVLPSPIPSPAEAVNGGK